MPLSIYGIQTDGTDFLFVRLDRERNVQIASVPGDERSRIYKYIDIILESVINCFSYATTGGVRTGIEFLVDSLPEEVVWQVMMGQFDGYEYIMRRGDDGQFILVRAEGALNLQFPFSVISTVSETKRLCCYP